MNVNVKTFLSVGAIVAALAGGAFADSPHFPVPDIIRPNVDFWIRIYTEVGLQEGLLHDREYPQVVYEKVVSGSRTGRARSDNIDARRQVYVNAITTVRDSAQDKWGAVENRVAEMFRALPAAALDSAEHRIRHQTGQRERFRAGLERSGAYIDTITAILRQHDVPVELRYLPHVESSFDYEAYSRVGAAGLWQFMRATGRSYNMRIDYIIDERRDPIISTVAAARFLRDNYNMLQAWPLAVTAYNHGPNGMRRAVQSVGSRDIAVILQRHESPTFKFASRNFYSCFVAVIRIMENVERYFPNVQYHPRFEATTVRMPFAAAPATVMRTFGISERDFKRLNRSFRPVMFTQGRPIPANYAINLPVAIAADSALAMLNALPAGQRVAQPTAVASAGRDAPRGTARAGRAGEAGAGGAGGGGSGGDGSFEGFDGYHTVQRGDNLYTIARNVGVSVNELAAANNITNSRRIYVGQVLRIPETGAAVAQNVVASTPPTDTTITTTAAAGQGQDAAGGVSFTTTAAGADGTVRQDTLTVDTVQTYVSTFTPMPSTHRLTSWRDPPVALAIPLDDPRRTHGVGREPAPVVADTVATVPSVPTTTAAATTPSVQPTTAPAISATAAMQVAETAPTAAVGRDGKPVADTRFDATAYDLAITVAADSASARVRVSMDETVGHFSEWMRVDAAEIRRANNMSAGASLRSGQRITIPAPNPSRIRRFETNRLQYHMANEEDFFARYNVVDFDRHVVRSGDNLWNLCRDAQVPIWLVRKFNRPPTVDLNNLRVGDIIWIPRVTSKDGSEAVGVVEELRGE